MMSSNSGGSAGGPGGGMGPGVGGGGDGRHDDEAALTEFLSSLMDYTPTVWCRCFPLTFFTVFCQWFSPDAWFVGAEDSRRAGGALPRPQRVPLSRPSPVSARPPSNLSP
jgi:hypothetical protein